MACVESSRDDLVERRLQSPLARRRLRMPRPRGSRRRGCRSRLNRPPQRAERASASTIARAASSPRSRSIQHEREPAGRRPSVARMCGSIVSELVADELLPRRLVDVAGLVRAALRPRPPVDLLQHVRGRLLPGCSSRHAASSTARFGSIWFDRRDSGRTACASSAISPSSSRVYPWRASAAIHFGSVRAASSPSALMTVCSFIATRESTFDHLPSSPCTFTFSHRCRWMCGSSARDRRCRSSTTSTRCERLTDAAARAAARVQLPLPRRDDPIAQPVLQRLELPCKLRVDQRGDAVRLRGVDRPVENQVGLRRTQIPAPTLVRVRVTTVDPTPQLGSSSRSVVMTPASTVKRVTPAASTSL